MISTLFTLAAIVALLLFWLDSMAASERARAHCRAQCQAGGLQLLDQSVALDRTRLARDSQGWLRLRRRYRFAVSTDGTDRRMGAMSLLGAELEWLSLPQIESLQQRIA